MGVNCQDISYEFHFYNQILMNSIVSFICSTYGLLMHDSKSFIALQYNMCCNNTKILHMHTLLLQHIEKVMHR